MRLIVLTTMLLASCATVHAPLSDESITGAWECGPTTMHGPDFDVVVTTRNTNNADHTYSSLSTSIITPHGQVAVTNQAIDHGTWRLETDVITFTVERVQFLSSSDPTFSNTLGQQIEDAQLKKKSVYRYRMLHFDGNTSRSVPVDPMYKEAEVESSCRRIQ
ncbi:MAG: hypothetical protein ACN6O2_11890 [Stenotrophomonas sp.]